jgi:hypothetical protein
MAAPKKLEHSLSLILVAYLLFLHGMIEKLIKARRVLRVQAHEWAGFENQAPIFADLWRNCKLLCGRISLARGFSQPERAVQ